MNALSSIARAAGLRSIEERMIAKYATWTVTTTCTNLPVVETWAARGTDTDVDGGGEPRDDHHWAWPCRKLGGVWLQPLL
jgi:hypothetical protein